MENATKALLIAAAVLIAILLIAVSMRVFNSTAGTADSVETTMNATEIATFNSKFTQHAGSDKSAAQVKSLAEKVIASNAVNKTNQVTFNGKNNANDIRSIVANYAGSYTVNVADTDGNGLIDAINVQ